MSSNVINLSDRATVLLLGASPAREAQIRAATKTIADVRTEASLQSAVAATQRLVPQVALADLTQDAAGMLAVVEELTRRAPNIPVMALAPRKDPELILKAMRAGAREFVVADDANELVSILTELLKKNAQPEKSGTIITVFPAKGGMGATTLAANLAAALLEGHKRGGAQTGRAGRFGPATGRRVGDLGHDVTVLDCGPHRKPEAL
jgi:pilus assembly protein CpaE